MKKAAFSDKVNEAIKASIDVVRSAYTKLFNLILKSGTFSSRWSKGSITLALGGLLNLCLGHSGRKWTLFR